MFRCPVCQERLAHEMEVYRCPKGHTFDAASQGYVNLLLANKKSKAPGDNGEMIAARSYFLGTGSYGPLCSALSETISALLPKSGTVLDVGCGEGYYARRLLAQRQDARLYGIDLSRSGVKRAARLCKEGSFAVASIFELPFADQEFDVVYNVFSPLCANEFERVLKPHGHFVAVYPAPRHLYEMKEILYEQPYENVLKAHMLPGFEAGARKRVQFEMMLHNKREIQSLFQMTPYFYHTPSEGILRLQALETLSMLADFWIVTYDTFVS